METIGKIISFIFKVLAAIIGGFITLVLAILTFMGAYIVAVILLFLILYLIIQWFL